MILYHKQKLPWCQEGDHRRKGKALYSNLNSTFSLILNNRSYMFIYIDSAYNLLNTDDSHDWYKFEMLSH